MRLKKKFARVVVAVAASAVATASCGGDSAEAPGNEGGRAEAATEIRVAINNTASSLLAVVAEDQGFFEEEGLDAEVSVVQNITQIPPALGKQYDIGFGVQPILILAASEGLPLCMVAGNEESTEENPVLVLMAAPGSDIDGPEGLSGKRLGAPTLVGNLHLATQYWLEEEGVDLSTVTSVQAQSPAMIDQLNAGLLDVAEMQQPFINIAKEQGFVEVGYPLAAVGEPAYMASWQADCNWAEQNRDAVESFEAALNTAADWISENETEARALLAEHTGLDAAVVAETPLPAFNTDFPTEAVTQWLEPMREIGGFAGDVDAESLVFSEE
jgi:ABC-type nitrate/sulfonate/bicarbonate transport system substrate-binding protein